ncbi:hypothetical protein DSM104299_04222 [Baekduia alba]|nr:hypothetical protein DSM104299_04222 [Baekduia alba]
MLASADALGLPAGARVTSFVSPTEARVEDEHGKGLLLQSTEPFATKDDSGALTKVDLSLAPQNGALVPDNPVVDVTLPDSATDPLTLPDTGLSIALAGGSNVTGDVEHDRVFYGDVSTDTDYITTPTRQGAQLMWQLRSALATETPSLDLDLPAGHHARLTSVLTGALSAQENPSVEIVDDTGTVVNTIQAPVAMDADQQPVPARYRLDGDRLSVEVPHREQQVKYPVLVDPEVRNVWGGADWDNFGTGPSQNQAGMWSLDRTGGNFGVGYQWQPYNATYAGRGLFMETMPGFTYWAGAAAWFKWAVPGYVNISSVWFDGLYHQNGGADHLFAGITGPYGWETVYNIWGDTNYDQSTQNPNPAWELATAVIGVWVDSNAYHSLPGWSGVRGVSILLGDTRPPEANLVNYIVNGQPQGGTSTVHNPAQTPDGRAWYDFPWRRSDDSVTATAWDSDPGLGTTKLGIFDQDNNWVGTPWQSSCIGHRSSPCPGAVQKDIPFAMGTNQLRGIHNLRTTAFDAVGNIGYGATFTMRVDADNPYVEVSGDLPSHSTDGTLGYEPTLNVYAEDDAMSSIGGHYHQSGVKKVDVYYTDPSGGVHHPMTLSAPGGCADDCDVSFPNVKLPITTPGHYGLNVVATDNTNHSGSRTLAFDVRYDTSWAYGHENHAIDTLDEMDAVGQALATSSNYQTIWNGLATSDKNVMMGGSDASFASWVGRIDTTAPSAPYDLDVQDYDASTHTASITWTEGEDSDLSSTLSGSTTEEGKASYRFKRAGGDWSSWRSTTDASFELGSLNPTDNLSVQVTDYDRAGNQSASLSDAVTIPTGPKASASIAFAIPILACVEWCPAIVAGVGAITASTVWTVNHQDFGAKHWPSSRDIAITRMDDNDQSFEDWEAEKLQHRDRLGRQGELDEEPDERSEVSPHHVVAVGAKAASYARYIMWKCGLDPNNWFDNGVWLPRNIHKKMHTKAYYQDINDMLKKYHPTFGSDPCGLNSGGIDLSSNGLRAAMRDIKRYLKDNYTPR